MAVQVVVAAGATLIALVVLGIHLQLHPRKVTTAVAVAMIHLTSVLAAVVVAQPQLAQMLTVLWEPQVVQEQLVAFLAHL
jgi:predicted metal-dependent hydrolase